MGDSVVLLDEPQAVDKFANVALLMDSHWGNEGKAYTSDVDGEPFQVEFGVRSSFQWLSIVQAGGESCSSP